MCNYNACCMSGGIPRHSLNFFSCFYQFIYIAVFCHKRSKFGRLFNSLVNRYFKLIRHQLCNGIHRSIGHSHCSADIPYCRPCLQCTEGYNLCNMVGTIFFSYIINNLLSAFVAEIYIKIGHRDPFRIQKSFKKKIILHRVNICDSYAICRNRACTGASAGTDRNILAFCIRNKIGNNKIIVGISHCFDC